MHINYKENVLEDFDLGVWGRSLPQIYMEAWKPIMWSAIAGSGPRPHSTRVRTEVSGIVGGASSSLALEECSRLGQCLGIGVPRNLLLLVTAPL